MSKTIEKNMLRKRAKRLPDVTDEMWKEVNEDYRNIVNEFLMSKNFSPKSKIQYESGLRQFGWFIQTSMNNKPLYKIKKRDFMRYISYLRDDRMMSSSAIKFKKSCVSSLCNFVEEFIAEDEDEENYRRFRNFTKGVSEISNNRVYDKIEVTHDEALHMLDVLKEDENYLGRAWLATAFFVGARKAEIIQFKTEILDYPVTDGQYYVQSHPVRGKGAGIDGKTLNYLIPVNVLKYWREWIEHRGYESEYIFTTKYGGEIKQMSDDWANYFCSHVLSPILGRRINPHIFKNSCITFHLKNGADMKFVSKYIAHHEDISTTQIYDLREFEDEKNEIFKKMFEGV